MTSPATPLPAHDDQPEIRVKVRGPGDLVAALPALIGHHPRDSVVLVVLGPPHRQVLLTMRLDLPNSNLPGVWRSIARNLGQAATQAGGEEAHLILVDGDRSTALSAADAFEADLHQRGIELSDVLVVGDDRYFSVRCDDRSCCPPGGRPIPTSSATTAAMVASGKVIHASREEIAAEIAAPTGKAADRAERRAALLRTVLTAQASRIGPKAVDDALEQACAGVTKDGLKADQAARLALLVRSGDGRDRAYLHMVTTGESRHRPVWAAVCRQVPERLAVVPLVLFSLAAYLEGDGAAANVGLHRALDADSTHAAVRLLHDLVVAGIPPRTVREALARAVPDAD